MQLYFSKILHDNGRIKDYRRVEINFYDNQELIVSCCDINNTAKEMFGDSGVEFFLNVDETNVTKLKTIVNAQDDAALLNFFHSKYSNQESSFENIIDFLKENNIDYNYSRW
ncbi:MAG: hypothetical protein K1X55_09965 [Chitinophagales bacterium]|nr:hypothetical protein [Chitinophagales bacterium]